MIYDEEVTMEVEFTEDPVDKNIVPVNVVTSLQVEISLVSHCENMKRRVVVLDMPKQMAKTGELIELRSMADSTYTAMFHPWILVFDRAAKRPGIIPPSSAVMGV